MGEIAAAYDLMPESTEVDLNAVLERIPGVLPAGVQIIQSEIRPVAFGLMKIYIGFIIDDSDEEIGGKLEDALRSLPGIDNVECVDNTVV